MTLNALINKLANLITFDGIMCIFIVLVSLITFILIIIFVRIQNKLKQSKQKCKKVNKAQLEKSIQLKQLRLEFENHNVAYRELEQEVLKYLKISHWINSAYTDIVYVKSSQAVDSYTYIQYFKEDPLRLNKAENMIKLGKNYILLLQSFLENNPFMFNELYSELSSNVKKILTNELDSYYIKVSYTSPAGNKHKERCISIKLSHIQQLKSNPQMLMTKADYNKYLKEQGQEILNQKHYSYYEMVNEVIDYANDNRDILLIEDDKNRLDSLISQLFDKTVNSIKKIKDINSEEWTMISNYIVITKKEIDKLVQRTQQILNYYKSAQFIQIKNTCNNLMLTQKEFNEYIDEKAQSISKLFGTKIVRNETIVEDEYNYVRPYKKSITPFTAEVSATVFASAENNPIDYIIKYFYPSKDKWPEQIQKLQILIEELETLKEAKQIIENYKKDYQQYISNVPDYVMKYDSDGFYSRLGFANINENVLTVEYKFSYTSNGGFSQRYFTVPMNEENIIELIETLQNKLNQSSFSKEQRRLMTSKLRQKIKERDNFTCRYCGNSIYKEPNLLLEVDHIIPIVKGGYTVEENLQTLCWKCNRHKSGNIVEVSKPKIKLNIKQKV